MDAPEVEEVLQISKSLNPAKKENPQHPERPLASLSIVTIECHFDSGSPA
jgi:hypothetical protein